MSDVDLSGSAVIRGQNIVGSNLLEAVCGASKALAKRPEARRMIVAFHSDLSVEMTSLTGEQIQNEVNKANATLIVVSLQAMTSNAKQRDNVLDNSVPGQRRPPDHASPRCRRSPRRSRTSPTSSRHSTS